MSCLFLHRILTSTRIEDYSDGLDPTAADFRAMLRRLARRHHFVSARELAAALAAGSVPDSRWLHLSFDDGFASTLVAAEICAGLKLPVTVFVSSRVLDGFVPWFVTMRHALASAAGPLELAGESFDPRDPRQALRLNALIKKMVYGSDQAPEHLLAAILEGMGCGELPPLPAKHRFLDAAGVAELASLGAEIGVHGAGHRALVALSPAQLAVEVVDSRRALAAACGATPDAFSYPEGLFDAAAREAVIAAGYAIAFAVDNPRTPVDRFAVPRRWLGRNLEAVGRPLAARGFELWGRIKARLVRAW